MQGNELVTDEVVSWRKTLGNRGRVLAAAIQLGNFPSTGLLGVEEDGCTIAAEASLGDLEPACAVAGAAAECARALVHPDQDWALAVSPLLPDSSHFVARCSGSHFSRRVTTVASQC